MYDRVIGKVYNMLTAYMSRSSCDRAFLRREEVMAFACCKIVGNNNLSVENEVGCDE
jgi:hypothetical protein